MSEPRGRSRSRPAWPYAIATVSLFLGFLIVWTLAGLVFGISRDLIITAVAAVIVTAGLGTAAIRRRAARPVLLLTALLTVAGAASLAADRL